MRRDGRAGAAKFGIIIIFAVNENPGRRQPRADMEIKKETSGKKRKRPVDRYFVDKQNMIRLIVFTGIFSLAFINLYKPFNSEGWAEYTPVGYFMMSFVLVLTGIAVLAISRTIMYKFVKTHSLYYVEYALWVFLEIVALSGFYTLYVIYFRDDLDFWNWEDIAIVFKDISLNTFMVILLPYSVSWLFFSYVEKRDNLAELQSRLGSGEKPVVQFKDEKGELRFSVSSENVVFLEAADNYVEINYLNQGKVVKHLLRTTLKRLSEDVENTSIRRCHRSYMVNFEHVTALRKNNGELDMELDVPGIKKIPVSKTYSDETTRAFLIFAGKRQGQ